MTNNNFLSLLVDLVSNPVSAVLLVFIVLMAVTSSKKYKAWREKRAAKKAA